MGSAGVGWRDRGKCRQLILNNNKQIKYLKNPLFVLEFCHFNYDVSCSGPLWVTLLGTLCVSWIWVTFSLIRLGKFSITSLFPQDIYPLLFFFSFWYSYYTDIVMFHVVLHFPYCLFILFEPLFLFLLFLGVFFSTLSSSSLIRSSASSSLLFIPSTVFFSSELYSAFPLGSC